MDQSNTMNDVIVDNETSAAESHEQVNEAKDSSQCLLANEQLERKEMPNSIITENSTPCVISGNDLLDEANPQQEEIFSKCDDLSGQNSTENNSTPCVISGNDLPDEANPQQEKIFLKCDDLSGQNSTENDTSKIFEIDKPSLVDYRDDSESDWTSDSHTSSSSESESSSSCSDDSSSPSENLDENTSKIKERIENSIAKNFKSHVEEGFKDLPPIENLSISVQANEITMLGTVSSFVEELVVIQATKEHPALNLDSVLFLESGASLGKIFDVFGPVAQPFYSIRFNTPEEILEKDVKIGDSVFCAPDRKEFTQYVFLEQLRRMKASDASWEHDKEAPTEFCDYSDDEEEKKNKMRQRARRAAPDKSLTSHQANKRSNRQPSTEYYTTQPQASAANPFNLSMYPYQPPPQPQMHYQQQPMMYTQPPPPLGHNFNSGVHPVFHSFSHMNYNANNVSLSNNTMQTSNTSTAVSAPSAYNAYQFPPPGFIPRSN